MLRYSVVQLPFIILFVLIFSPELFTQNTLNADNVSEITLASHLLTTCRDMVAEANYSEALHKADSAKQIYSAVIGKDSKEVAFCGLCAANAYMESKDYENASMEYIASLDILRLLVISDSQYNKCTILKNLAYCEEQQEKFESAIKYYKESLECGKGLNPIPYKDLLSSYYNLCSLFSDIGQLDNSLFFLTEMEAVINGIDSNDISKYVTQEISLNSIKARVLGKMGLFTKALYHHKRTLDLSEREYRNGNVKNIANAYGDLGIGYKNTGDYEKALQCHYKSLDIRIKEFGEYHPACVNSYLNIGVTLMEKDEYAEAAQSTEKAISILEKIGRTSSFVYGLLLDNLAICQTNLGNYDKAIENHKAAMKITAKLTGDDNSVVAISTLNIGNAYVLNNHRDSALSYLHKTLEMVSSETKNALSPIVMNLLGKVHFNFSQLDSSEYYYNRVMEICNYNGDFKFENVSPIQDVLDALKGLMQIASLDTSTTEKAQFEKEQLVQSALSGISFFQSNFENESAKAEMVSKMFALIEASIQLDLNKQEQKPSSFFISERFKALLLKNAIRQARANQYFDIPDSLTLQEQTIKEEIARYDRERLEMLLGGYSQTDTTVVAISGKIFDLSNKFDKVNQRFQKEYPEYYRLKHDLSTVSLPYVQDTLLQKDQALLEYFVGDSAIFAFVVRPDTFAVLEIPNDFGLDSLVNQLRHGIYGYYEANKLPALYAPTAQQYTEAATILYNKLISPVQSLLHKRLIIVPDGVLGYVPFEALLLRADDRPERFHLHHYFGQEHIISYAYSATLLREMRAKKHRKEPQGKVLAMAPFFRGDVRKLSESIASGEALLALRSDTLSALPDSGEEALRIAKAYKGKSLIGKEATKAAFEREASDYRILHLSTHGVADDRVGDYAWLGFAKPGAQDQFEKLYVRDIYNLSLNADLVVLSACQAGIGKLQRGEGIISLSRAFAYAGAKGIITTLWSVDDEKTKDFMLAFYGHLRKMSAAEALWQTRRDFLTKRTGEAAHPYFWAGFIGVGDL